MKKKNVRGRGSGDGPREQEAKKSIIEDIKSLIDLSYIKSVPSYGNGFFFTIGVYLLVIFALLAATGIIMAVFGPFWASSSVVGNFMLSIHLWAAEAFVTLMLIHMIVQLSTSVYKSRKLQWMIGSLMLLLVFFEFAFGMGIIGSFVGQYNAAAGADLWNGMGLGFWVNPLNTGAVYGWHIAIIPIFLIGLMAVHFLLARKKEMSTPYRNDIPYSIVPTNHRSMYRRTAYIFALILIFAILFRAPFSAPLTIQGVAQTNSSLVAITLLNEFNHTSGTATYLDTIDPYKYDTANVYVAVPYSEYANTPGVKNELSEFYLENASQQNSTIQGSFSYFKANGTIAGALNSSNPLTATVGTLVVMAQSGIYGSIVQDESLSGLNQTYTLNFLRDTEEITDQGLATGLDPAEWGMLQVEQGPFWSIGAYWLIPYNMLQLVTVGIPWWGDLENGVTLGILFMIFMLLPYIPYLRDAPDRLGLYKLFWNRFTVPELKAKHRQKKKKA